MKKIIAIILLNLTTILVNAQEMQHGYLQVLSVLKVDSPSQFFVSGKEIRRVKIKYGDKTFTYPFSAIKHNILVKNDDCKNLSDKIKIEKGKKHTAIIYPIYEKDKNGEIKEIKIGLNTKTGINDLQTAQMSFISVLKKDIVLTIDKRRINVPKEKTETISLKSLSNSVPVKMGDELLKRVIVIGPYDYALLLYEKLDGSVGVISFINSLVKRNKEDTE